MGFYEDIAEALDAEGIESRVNDGILFVPITPAVEIHFEELDTSSLRKAVPAANVFIAVADVSEDDDDFDATLVGVVFSVEAAVAEVAKHILTDQILTVLDDLLDGTDDRIADLQFEQDANDPHLVRAEVGDDSHLTVLLEAVDGVARATVRFLTYGEDFENLLELATEEFWEAETRMTDQERQDTFRQIVAEVSQATEEVLELGCFTDFDLLFDALAVAQLQAHNWEELLVPLEDEDGDELAYPSSGYTSRAERLAETMAGGGFGRFGGTSGRDGDRLAEVEVDADVFDDEDDFADEADDDTDGGDFDDDERLGDLEAADADDSSDEPWVADVDGYTGFEGDDLHLEREDSASDGSGAGFNPGVDGGLTEESHADSASASAQRTGRGVSSRTRAHANGRDADADGRGRSATDEGPDAFGLFTPGGARARDLVEDLD